MPKKEFWTKQGWIWYGTSDDADGKFIIDASYEQVQKMAVALAEAVDRKQVRFLKYPDTPNENSAKSVLIVYVQKKQIEQTKSIIETLGSPFHWTWDGRDNHRISWDRGAFFISGEEQLLEGQRHLFKALCWFWCYLLRYRGTHKVSFSEQDSREQHIFEAVFWHKTGWFAKTPVMKVEYAFFITQKKKDASRPSSMRIRIVDKAYDKIAIELKDSSKKELQKLTENVIEDE